MYLEVLTYGCIGYCLKVVYNTLCFYIFLLYCFTPDCIFRKIQLSIFENPANILIPDFAFMFYFCSMIRFGFGRFGKNHICTYSFNIFISSFEASKEETKQRRKRLATVGRTLKKIAFRLKEPNSPVAQTGFLLNAFTTSFS
jgi:hypothetical protein